MISPRVILIARRSEFNLHYIESVLLNRRIKYVVVDPDYDSQTIDFTIWIGEKFFERLYDRTGASFNLDCVRAVWTRGTGGYAGDTTPCENSTESRAIAETKHAYAYLWSLMSDRHWINPLPSLEQTNRLTQARHAALIGLRVAQSIVSTRGEDIRLFLQQHPQCIVKAISQGGRLERGPGLVMTETLPIDVELDERNPVPILAQEFVLKDHELRVAVVGDKVFAAAIDSFSDERTRVDSRLWVETDLTHYRVTLSEEERMALVRLNACLGYVYSSMDLIRSPDGKLTFLEANPAGQWTFLESQTGYPITEALVELLCSS